MGHGLFRATNTNAHVRRIQMEEIKFPITENMAMFVGFHEGMLEMMEAGFTREEAFELTKLFIQNGIDDAVMKISEEDEGV